MRAYESAFATVGLLCGQVLLAPTDFMFRRRYLKSRGTLHALLEAGSCPSSTRTTPLPTTRSGLATTTGSAPSSPTWSRRRGWCCSPTRRGSSPPILGSTSRPR
ncbi:MAG: hypothetical protein R2710_28495 [Acidimicrobiales bacterium]